MKEDDRLDPVDRRIVRALQRDASLSHAALAEEVGASAASVWRRVRALEKAGVLGKTVRLCTAPGRGRARPPRRPARGAQPKGGGGGPPAGGNLPPPRGARCATPPRA